jgi:hypothetical protein
MILLSFSLTAATGSGGFELRAQNAVGAGSVIQIQPYGCHQPEQAQLEGTAEGLVNGERQSMPLTFSLSTRGLYDVAWEQPAEGDWVLAVSGIYRGYVSSLIVEINDNGEAVLPAPDRYGRRIEPIRRALTASDVEQALQKMAYAGY